MPATVKVTVAARSAAVLSMHLHGQLYLVCSLCGIIKAAPSFCGTTYLLACGSTCWPTVRQAARVEL